MYWKDSRRRRSDGELAEKEIASSTTKGAPRLELLGFAERKRGRGDGKKG